MTTFRLPSSGLYPSPRHLIYAVQHAKANLSNPDTRYSVGEWSDKLTPAEYLKWFRKKLNEKISFNGHIDYITRTAKNRQVRYCNHVNRPLRKLLPEYQITLRRDAARLSGYGGFGRNLETPEVRKRLRADHVHFYLNGTIRLCGDRDCEH